MGTGWTQPNLQKIAKNKPAASLFFMSKRFSWDDQRAFLAVLEEGSLSGAARRLELSHATIRSRIEALEAALGTVLFTRSVSGLTPTPYALGLRDSAKMMAMASDQFVRQASAPPGEVAGTVRISVPEFMGIEVIPTMLGTLRAAYPAIQIELSLSNAVADLLAQEVDVAVRTVAPTQNALVARKVADIPLGFFASRAYLNKRGIPKSISEMAMHDLIGPDRNRNDQALASRLGTDFEHVRFILRTDSHPAQLAAARAGLGIAVTQVPVGERDLNLCRVLPDYIVARLGTWIVTHENLKHVPKVRAVLDCLTKAFL